MGNEWNRTNTRNYLWHYTWSINYRTIISIRLDTPRQLSRFTMRSLKRGWLKVGKFPIKLPQCNRWNELPPSGPVLVYRRSSISPYRPPNTCAMKLNTSHRFPLNVTRGTRRNRRLAYDSARPSLANVHSVSIFNGVYTTEWHRRTFVTRVSPSETAEQRPVK